MLKRLAHGQTLSMSSKFVLGVSLFADGMPRIADKPPTPPERETPPIPETPQFQRSQRHPNPNALRETPPISETPQPQCPQRDNTPYKMYDTPDQTHCEPTPSPNLNSDAQSGLVTIRGGTWKSPPSCFQIVLSSESTFANSAQCNYANITHCKKTQIF